MTRQRVRTGASRAGGGNRAPPSERAPEWGTSLADDAEALRSVLDGMAEAVVVADAAGRLVYFNRAAEQLHGIGLTTEPPEGWGKRYGIFLEDGVTPCPPDQVPLARAIRGEGPDHVRLYLRRPDGTGAPVEVNGRPIRAGRSGPVVGGVVVFADVTRRMESERKVRESEARLRSTLDGLLEGCMIIGFDWTYLYVNDALAAQGHTRRAEMVGRRMQEVYPGIEQTAVFEEYRRCMEERVPRRFESEYVYSDGSKGSYEQSAEPVPEGIFVLALEVTERKRAEQQLAASSGYARGLIEASLDPLVTISAEGKITDVNAATETVTGVPRAELVGSDFCTYFTEPDKAQAGYRSVFAQGAVRDYPLTIRHRSGTTTDVVYNATIYRNSAGDVQGVFAAARDVTERKRSEREIARLNRLYRVLSRAGEAMVRVQSADALFDEACRNAVEVGGFRMAWVAVADEGTRLVRPAAAYGECREYAATERFSVDDVAEGRGPTGTAYREGRPFVCRDIEREPQMAPWRANALAAGFRASASFPLRSGSAVRAVFTVYSGEAGWFGEEEMHLLEELTSNISYALESLEHEDRRRHAEEEVRALAATLERRVVERTAELAAANDELQAFAYSVSHDLRSPLRSINGFSQALAEDCSSRLDETGLGHLSRIQAATRRMGGMIDDLLKLSRVTRSEMHRERVDVSALAAEVVADLRRDAQGRQVEVAIEQGLLAYADRSLTRIVLENLLGNAWKFTAPRDRTRIEVARSALGDRRAICVRDNGVGFDMQYADRLFKPFQRLHTAEEFEGTGIGLATVHRIVQRHGGRIVASGSSDGGAAFTFRLE